MLNDKRQGHQLPIHLEALLTGERVELEYFDSDARFDGRIEIVGGVPAIFVNRRRGRSDDPRTRFTLAHEIAHFYLHSRLLQAGTIFDDQTIEPDASAVSGVELEANIFASELLLPSALAEKEVRGKLLTLGRIREIAALAHVSLQATAIRLTDVTSDRCCALLVVDGVIAWCAGSQDWRNRGLPTRVLRKQPLPADTVVARRVDDFDDVSSSLAAWAPQLEFRDVPLYESAMATPFGRLVFLGADDFDL